MIRNKCAALTLGCIMATCYVPFPAYAGPLYVYVQPIDADQRTSPNIRWKVFLEGEIDTGAADRVAQETAQIGDEKADVYVDSPGGSLMDGMRIGRLLRRLGANTLLGKRGTRNSGTEPGVCLSACAIAFLGGVQRYVPSGAVFGVHRVSTAVHSDEDFDAGQIVAAQVLAYIREMGVDSRLFDRMASTGKERISVLSVAEMRALHVIDDGKQPAQWRFGFTKQAPSLMASQQTSEGTEQVAFDCDKGKVIFHSIYYAGINANVIASGQWTHALLIDDTALPLDAPSSIEDVNGDLRTTFTLSPEQARRMIGAASSVGHMMQGARSDPSLGYKIDIDSRAGTTVREFMASCTE